jgi:hypothetical protein
MSDWDAFLGDAALGRDLVPLDQVRGEGGQAQGAQGGQRAQRPPGLMLLDQPRAQPTQLASTSSETIFRQEALEFRTRGQDTAGGVVRLGARWLHWSYRVTLVLIAAAVASLWLIRTGESSSGPAVVNSQAGTVTAVLPAVAGPDLAHAQDFTVTLPGGRPAQVSIERAQLASVAAIGQAGFTPPSQPGILVTGRLAPGAATTSAERAPELRTQATITLRTQSLATVLARQFRSMLGQGAAL